MSEREAEQYWVGYAEALVDVLAWAEVEYPELTKEFDRVVSYVREDRLGGVDE